LGFRPKKSPPIFSRKRRLWKTKYNQHHTCSAIRAGIGALVTT
jgi:hypothetical protein